MSAKAADYQRHVTNGYSTKKGIQSSIDSQLVKRVITDYLGESDLLSFAVITVSIVTDTMLILHTTATELWANN